MVRWKNRPIEQLNEAELRNALAELVFATVSRKAPSENLILDSFWAGLVLGATGTLLGLSIYALMA